MIYTNLNPNKALIWRIVHRDNLQWILDNGLHCGNSLTKASDWVDWPLLQKRDFKRDPDDPAKLERYQAEALV
jgi:hypothetical protein